MKGSITIIGGYPNEGKTSSALRIARKMMSKGTPCLYFCLDVHEHEIRNTIYWLNAEGGLGMTDLRLLDVCEAAYLGVEGISDILHEYLDRGVKPVAFIDYIQLMPAGQEGTDDLTDHVSASLTSLRSLADEHGIDFYVLMQARRRKEQDKDIWYTSSQLPLGPSAGNVDNIWFVKRSPDGPGDCLVVCQGDTPAPSVDVPTESSRPDEERLRSFHRTILEIRKVRNECSDKEFIDTLTDRLLEVARHPSTRKDYSVPIPGDNPMYCSVNRPMMSSIERLAMVRFRSNQLLDAWTDEAMQRIYDEISSIIEGIDDSDDHFSALAIRNARRSEWHFSRGEHAKALEFAASGLDHAASTCDGVHTEDLNLFLYLMKMDEGSGELFRWISDTKSALEQKEWDYFDHDCDAFDDSAYMEYAEKSIRYVESRWEEINSGHQYDIYGWLPSALMEAFELVKGRTRRSPKKNSFDWHYARAEKGVRESQEFISEAYRTGDGVARNVVLSDFWKSKALSH